MDKTYADTVRLLLAVAPDVFANDIFALKGGTAINLFVRDMPRLSVDIDLTYIPVEPRPESLVAIDAAMSRIARRLRDNIQGVRVAESRTANENIVTKLIARAPNRVQTKIEVTPVLRGCVYQPERRSVSPSVEDAFGFA